MADRRGDAMRQQPPYSSGHQERVFDGGGGPAFGNDYDTAGSSYMALLGSGVNPQQSLPPQQAWGVDEVTPPTINLTPQFSMVSKDRLNLVLVSPLQVNAIERVLCETFFSMLIS